MTVESEVSSNLNLSRSTSPIYFNALLGFLNYKGLGGEFIVLVDESRLSSHMTTRRYYKIESLTFVAMTKFEPQDDRIMRRLDSF